MIELVEQFLLNLHENREIGYQEKVLDFGSTGSVTTWENQCIRIWTKHRKKLASNCLPNFKIGIHGQHVKMTKVT